jgi:hypothetical protein
MHKHSIEWAAGLFEGEGCIYFNGKRHSLHLGGKDLDVIQSFSEVMGVGNVIERKAKRSEEHSTIYMWQTYAADKVRHCLDVLLPHLGNRRAHKALDVLDHLELQT